VINTGRDARNVIISRRMKHEEIEAYSPSSNYRIPAHTSASFKKRKPATTHPQGRPQVTSLKVSPAPNTMEKHLRRRQDQQNTLTKVLYAPQELPHNLRVQLSPQGPWSTLGKGNFTQNLVDYHAD